GSEYDDGGDVRVPSMMMVVMMALCSDDDGDVFRRWWRCLRCSRDGDVFPAVVLGFLRWRIESWPLDVNEMDGQDQVI
ncbi:hypothetical protein Tco_1452920, partial [Tanacetum coccineum]